MGRREIARGVIASAGVVDSSSDKQRLLKFCRLATNYFVTKMQPTLVTCSEARASRRHPGQIVTRLEMSDNVVPWCWPWGSFEIPESFIFPPARSCLGWELGTWLGAGDGPEVTPGSGTALALKPFS